MSLSVGKFFYHVLSNNTTVMSATSGRIFPVARTMEEDEQDKIPYVIIMPSGVTNNEGTKDSTEGETDTENIDLMVVAKTYEQLLTIVESIRQSVRNAVDSGVDYDNWPFYLQWYNFSADAIQFDQGKPCFFVNMHYNCSTLNK